MIMHRSRPRVAQALVEFALVVPLLVGLSFGILQLMLYAHARDVVTSSVQEGARLAAEDGRGLDEGFARTRSMLSAGLGAGLEPLAIDGSLDPDTVHVRVDAGLVPILPLGTTLPIHVEAWVARERFRPGGGRPQTYDNDTRV
jgi:TadE-like protein